MPQNPVIHFIARFELGGIEARCEHRSATELEKAMRTTARTASYSSRIESISRRVAIWNQRLLTAAVIVTLWAASVVALQAAGPNAQAMLAGEGMLIITAD